jgi:hypothetical protein
MRVSYWLVASLAVLFVVGVSTAQPPTPKPGPEHEHFKEFEGTWDAVVKTEGAPDAKGTMTYKVDHGGLWLISDFRAADFSGHGVSSYDARKKKYVGAWIDSMSTLVMNIEGTLDEKTQTMTEMAETVGPDGKPMKMKMVTKMKDKDSHVFTMYMAVDGKDQEMMSIEYKRQPKKK